jgi:hypothetical protein
MHRIEMTEVDQRIAKVCDPATANRYAVVYHNPNTDEHWLVARVLPSDLGRYKEALLQQGCEIVIANMEAGEWNSIEWLRLYRKDAPLQEIAANLHALRWDA